MSFNENTTAIVDINSHKGVDGSTALTAIPDGFCEEMENCDISTAQSISKRPGYQTHGGDIPTNLLNFEYTTQGYSTRKYINRTRRMAYRGDGPTGEILTYTYTDANLTALIDPYLYLTTRNLSGKFYILKLTDIVDGYYSYSPAVGDRIMWSLFSPWNVTEPRPQEITIRAVVTNGIYIINTKDYTTLTANTTKPFTGSDLAIYSGLSFSQIVETDVISLTTTVGTPNEHTVRVNLSHKVFEADYVYFPLLGAQGVVVSTTDTATYRDVKFKLYSNTARTTPENTAITTDYFQLLYTAPWIRIGEPGVVAAYPDTYFPVRREFEYWISDGCINVTKNSPSQDINYPTYAWGLCVDNKYVSSVDEFYNLQESNKQVTCTSNGKMLYLNTDFQTAFLPLPLAAGFLTAGTYNAASGYDPVTKLFTIPVTDPNYEYTLYPGDDLIYQEYSSIFTAPEQYILRITSTSTFGKIIGTLTKITSTTTTSPVSFTVKSNVKCEYKRNDATIFRIYSLTATTDTSLVSSNTFQINGVEDPDLQNVGMERYYIHQSNAYLSAAIRCDKPITFYSTDTFSTRGIWLPIMSPVDDDWAQFLPNAGLTGTFSSLPLKPLDTYAALSTNTPVGAFDNLQTLSYSASVLATSHESGMWRYDGFRVQSMELPKPFVLSLRSIPNTKGYFPVTLGSNDEKIGEELQLIATISYVDPAGRVYESYPTEKDEMKIIPNACADGSDTTELVQISVIANISPSMVCASSLIYLNIYRNIQDPTTASELDFRLEKSVPITISGASNIPVTITIGDKGVTDAGNREILTALVNDRAVTPPRASILSTTSNRIVAANMRTPPYVQITGDTIYDSAGTFAAWAKVTVFGHYPMMTVPLGIKTAALPLPTFYTSTDFTNKPSYVTMPSPTSVAYTNTQFSVASFKLTYQDASNRFQCTAATTQPTAGKSIVFRPLNTDYTDTPSQIKFLKEIFFVEAATVPNTTNMRSGSKNLSANVDANLTPTYLVGKKFLYLTELSAGVVVTASASDYIQAQKTSETSSEILLYLSSPPASLTTYYITVSGAGTLGNITDPNYTKILSWDTDLTFRVTGTWTGPTTPFTLIPVDITTGKDLQVTVNANILLASDYNDGNYTMKLFGSPVATISQYYSTFTKFTTPSTVLLVEKANIGTMFPVGSRAVFEMDPNPTLASKFSKGFPSLVGNFEVKTSASGAITVEVPASYEIFTETTGFVIAAADVGANSFIINVRKVFEHLITVDGNVVNVLGIPMTAYVSNGEENIFVCIRGRDFNTVCLDVSGPRKSYGDINSGFGYHGVLLQPLVGLTAAPLDIPWLNNVTGFYCSAVIQGGVNIPIPVPVKGDVAESWSDLALPVFTQNKNNTSLMLTQVTKRMAAAISTIRTDDPWYLTNLLRTLKTTYGLFGDLKYLNINSDENSAVFLSPQEEQNINILKDIRTGYIGASNVSLTVQAPEGYYRVYATDMATNKAGTYEVTRTETSYGYVIDSYPNLIQWTNTIVDNALVKQFPAFRANAKYDLGSSDDAEITALVPFRDWLLVFKRNSVWRIQFGEKIDQVEAVRLQSTAGCLSPRNAVATDDGVYFVHESGVYVTDGNTISPVFQLNRLFRNNVVNNPTLLAQTASYVNMVEKNVYLGVPYMSQFVDDVAAVDGQFNYSYNDNVLGWQVNKGIDAVDWVFNGTDALFASTRGKVYRMRTEKTLSRYRDGDQPITMALKTRFLTTEQSQRFKFYRNALFQWSDNVDANIAVYYSENFKPALIPLETYALANRTSTVDGQKVFGTDRFVKTWRDTIGKRIAQISFTIVENGIDAGFTIYSVAVEGWLTNTRLVSQKGQTDTSR